ncbi:MAG: hypothetical protein LBB19_03530 [Puniceicoccales bacterium]|jgi:hypothetical protein|nr:hypothetical protein [Puniceicoccales bacterium]
MKAYRKVLYFLLPLCLTSGIIFAQYHLQFEEDFQSFLIQKHKLLESFYPTVLKSAEEDIEYHKGKKLDLKEHILSRMGSGFILHNDRDLVDCWQMSYYLQYLQNNKILLLKEELSIIERVLAIMKWMISHEGKPEDKDALDKLSVDKIFVEVKETEKSFLRQIFPFWKS